MEIFAFAMKFQLKEIKDALYALQILLQAIMLLFAFVILDIINTNQYALLFHLAQLTQFSIQQLKSVIAQLWVKC